MIMRSFCLFGSGTEAASTRLVLSLISVCVLCPLFLGWLTPYRTCSAVRRDFRRIEQPGSG